MGKYIPGIVEMTPDEAVEFVAKAAAAIDARLHGGQSSGPRQKMISEEIWSQLRAHDRRTKEHAVSLVTWNDPVSRA